LNAGTVFLILHGWQGSGPDHWQTWLADRLRARGQDVRYPPLPHQDDPQLQPWLEALRSAVSGQPSTVICHSLSCILWLHLAASASGPIAGRVLLVAPPSPSVEFDEVRRFFPHGADAEAVARAARSTQLVCSDNDPYCPEGALALYGEPLAIQTEVIPGGGHLNPEAGYGEWPAIEQWCLRTKN
jgi:uncharacterized protein